MDMPARQRRLQCGHSPKAVENIDHATASVVYAGRASMRPQPEGRGELTSGGIKSASQDALQCGHSPKAVENYHLTV